jgi:hypothetical protein
MNIIIITGAFGAGAATCCGSGSSEMMRLLAAIAPAPQHCLRFFMLIVKDYKNIFN